MPIDQSIYSAESEKPGEFSNKKRSSCGLSPALSMKSGSRVRQAIKSRNFSRDSRQERNSDLKHFAETSFMSSQEKI